jgi:hypothetical protein
MGRTYNRLRTVDRDVPNNRSAKTERIDLGLAILSALSPAGQVWERIEIAAFCGCTNEYIRAIEFKALKKLRHRLKHANLCH